MSGSGEDFVIGVVSDTHVPDRVANLHPGLVPGLRAAGVELILHAGDICSHAVIEELESVAPVKAVYGNRDLFFNEQRYHAQLAVEIYGVRVGLMHGHGGLWRYIYEKFEMASQGYRFSNYHRLAIKTFPEADIIIYGHTHFPENEHVQDKLIFNPGSAGIGGWRKLPSYGIIRVEPGGNFYGIIYPLQGAHRVNGKWRKDPEIGE